MSDETTSATATGPLQVAMERLANFAIAIAALALVGLVVIQGWQVFARYVLNNSPSWTEPVTLLLLSTAMGMGAASGVYTNRHFGFVLLAEAMPPHIKRVVDAIAPIVIAVIGAFLAWWGFVLLLDGLDVKMAGAPLPQSIPFLPLAVSGALMVVFALNRLALILAAPAKQEGAV
jgi:TRAP-type C4-dicarboxylate transport system permease small subunit